MPYITVMGMEVPVALVPHIVAAFRDTYPGVTEGLNDDSAVRAVVKYWVATTLAEHKAKMARAPLDGEMASVRQQYTDAAEQARQEAMVAAEAIREMPADVP